MTLLHVCCVPPIINCVSCPNLHNRTWILPLSPGALGAATPSVCLPHVTPAPQRRPPSLPAATSHASHCRRPGCSNGGRLRRAAARMERESGAKCFHSPSSGRSKSASGSIESGCWRENRACASCLICLTLISEFSRMWYLNLDNNILRQHLYTAVVPDGTHRRRSVVSPASTSAAAIADTSPA